MVMRCRLFAAVCALLGALCTCLPASGAPEEGAAFPRPCAGLDVELAGMTVTPHGFSNEIRYRKPPAPELGALVRLVFRHTNPGGAPVPIELLFNGKKPAELLDAEAWSWCEMPAKQGRDPRAFVLAPERWAVFTFNGAGEDWGAGERIALTVRDAASEAEAGLRVRLEQTAVQLSSVVFLADEGIYPERMTAHVTNAGADPAEVRAVRFYGPSAGGLALLGAAADLRGFGGDLSVPAGGRSGFTARLPHLPLARGLVEVVVVCRGAEQSLWAPLRFKRDRFDIGSGWLEIPSAPGVVPLTREPFLKLLERLGVNTAHCEHVPGYTDDTGPGGLYTRYPLRLMAGFKDVANYNSDAWVARIHGVDAVGEPQMGLGPRGAYEALRHYDGARYPTTVTLSDDSGFRYYAGLSDFPHYDAYRVTAPSSDVWGLYDRWDKRIFWGAPLEGIGAMTRTLRALSRPAPIALWSQSVHEGWRGGLGRKRRSPTPDEILLQAYEGLANGAKSLYWYSLQSWSVLKYRDALPVTERIGREIRALENLYLEGDPFEHQRVTRNGVPDLDLNSLVTPDAAVLFAMDLAYRPDHEAQVFVFDGPRPLAAHFDLPDYLRPVHDVFRIDAAGVYDAPWRATDRGVMLRGALDRVGVYVAAREDGLRAQLAARLAALEAEAQALAFDPARNDADFQVLLEALGFEDMAGVERAYADR